MKRFSEPADHFLGGLEAKNFSKKSLSWVLTPVRNYRVVYAFGEYGGPSAGSNH